MNLENDTSTVLSLAAGTSFAYLFRWDVTVPAAMRMNTVTDQDSRCVFPGSCREHLHRQTIIDRLRGAGVSPRANRNTAWQQLVRQASPQVLADTLGISAVTAMQHT